MRKLIILGAVVFALFAGAAVYLFSSIDGIVKTVIETAGTKAIGVKVSVGSVKIALKEGRGSISDFEVANPPGFSSDPAIKVAEITLALDIASLTRPVVVVKEVLVGAPAIGLELGPDGGTNLQVLQNNLKGAKGNQGVAPTETAQAEAAKTPSPEEQRKVAIDRLAITGGQVKLAAGGIPGAAATAKLADIVLTGIGRDSGGATGTQVAQKVLEAVINGAVKAAGSLGNVLGSVEDRAKGLVPGEAGAALKGLFGK